MKAWRHLLPNCWWTLQRNCYSNPADAWDIRYNTADDRLRTSAWHYWLTLEDMQLSRQQIHWTPLKDTTKLLMAGRIQLIQNHWWMLEWDRFSAANDRLKTTADYLLETLEKSSVGLLPNNAWKWTINRRKPLWGTLEDNRCKTVDENPPQNCIRGKTPKIL